MNDAQIVWPVSHIRWRTQDMSAVRCNGETLRVSRLRTNTHVHASKSVSTNSIPDFMWESRTQHFKLRTTQDGNMIQKAQGSGVWMPCIVQDTMCIARSLHGKECDIALCIYIYIYIYACICVYIYIYTHRYLVFDCARSLAGCRCRRGPRGGGTCTPRHRSRHVCVYIYIYIYIYIHECMQHIYVYIYIYTHITHILGITARRRSTPRCRARPRHMRMSVSFSCAHRAVGGEQAPPHSLH